jgi:RsiW-degrading membrane proteinase PrsW (M82 family)
VLPLAAWFVFSYRGERRAIEPRPKLIGMLILGALMANGLLIPLEERLFTPNSWLPDASFFGRVLGFTLTIGIVSEFMRYAVLRYTIWPQCFRQRLDGIAYALAVSMGFATMYNLRIATDPDITLVATALRVASITFSQLSLGLFAGFFLAELKIVRPPIFWMPSGVFGAALLSGFYFAFRNIAIIGGIKLGSTASSPIRGLLLAAGVVIVMFVVFAFIIDNADARMEAQTGRRQTL